MAATKNDFTRLIQFSLDKQERETAVRAFPMFTPGQISYIYSMTPSARRMLLEQRTTVDPVPQQYRNREQAQKMAEIAVDPSNR